MDDFETNVLKLLLIIAFNQENHYVYTPYLLKLKEELFNEVK